MKYIYDKPLFFRKEFKFKNKKERNKFFDQALIDGNERYKKVNERDFDEKLHILFSWKVLTYILSYVILFFLVPLYLFNLTNLTINICTIFVSLLCYMSSLFFEYILQKVNESKIFTMDMLEQNDESINEVRQQLIKNLTKI